MLNLDSRTRDLMPLPIQFRPELTPKLKSLASWWSSSSSSVRTSGHLNPRLMWTCQGSESVSMIRPSIGKAFNGQFAGLQTQLRAEKIHPMSIWVPVLHESIILCTPVPSISFSSQPSIHDSLTILTISCSPTCLDNIHSKSAPISKNCHDILASSLKGNQKAKREVNREALTLRRDREKC